MLEHYNERVMVFLSIVLTPNILARLLGALLTEQRHRATTLFWSLLTTMQQ